MPTVPDFDLSNVFEPSPNATAVLDLELRVAAVNAAFLKLTGANWSEIAHRPLFDGLALTGATELRRSFERVIASGLRDDRPVVPYLADQSVSVTNTPLLDRETGAVRWILHQVADVTALQTSPAVIAALGTGILSRAGQTSAELAVLRRLFDQAPGFVCFLRGPEHRFELTNPAYLTLIGKTSAIIGQSVYDAVPEVRDQGFIEILDQVLQTGQPHVGRGVEILLAREPGQVPEPRVIDFVYQPIVVDGMSIGIFVQGIDITEARRAETDRARDHAELVARAAYEERLIGIVSHDLRNPLSTISLAIPILESEQLGTAGKKAVGYIKASAARSERLISDLLDFAQARSGNFPITPEPTNLPSLVRAAVEGARMLTGPRPVTLEHRGPATGVWDEGRLTQVIANLVGNAFQHAPADALIRVRSAVDGDLTSIEVFNEGPAIREQDLPRLFDPFSRGKNAVTKQGRSIGLGLFIASQIAVAHGGSISVASIAGQGTTFTVHLPTRTVR